MFRQAGFYGPAFDVDKGSTIGDPVSPTIFNIVEDAVLRLWSHRIALALDLVSGVDVVAIFYADDGQLAGFDGPKLQLAFELMTELFSRVGLTLNPRKTQSMTCGTRHHFFRQSSPAFKRRLSGEGEDYSQRRRRAVSCPECGVILQARSLAAHRARAHGVEYQASTPTKLPCEVEEPQTYEMVFPAQGIPGICPVEGCGFAAMTRYSMRRHFAYRHHRDSLIIDVEGPMQKCTACGMHVGKNWRAHPGSELCKRLCKRLGKVGARDELIAARRLTFTASEGLDLESVESFRYLGRIVTSSNEDWPAFHRNLRRAAAQWAKLRRVLVRDGANPKVCGYFYKAVCQSVLLMRSKVVRCSPWLGPPRAPLRAGASSRLWWLLWPLRMRIK